MEVAPDNPKWYTISHELIILDYKAVAWEGNGLQINKEGKKMSGHMIMWMDVPKLNLIFHAFKLETVTNLEIGLE